MSENKLRNREVIDAELQKTKAELAIAKHRQAKPRRAHTREACISAPLSNVAQLHFSVGDRKCRKGGRYR